MMNDAVFAKVSGREISLEELYSPKEGELDELKRQLVVLENAPSEWLKGGKLDVETVGDFLVIFSILYANMWGNRHGISDMPRQAFFDEFVPLDESLKADAPIARSVSELFTKDHARDYVLAQFEMLPCDISDWLEGEYVSFTEVFVYLEVFRELYKLLVTNTVSDKMSIFSGQQ